MCVRVLVRFRTKRELGYQPENFGPNFVDNEGVVKFFELENNKPDYTLDQWVLTRQDSCPLPQSRDAWQCLEKFLIVTNGGVGVTEI